MSLNQALHARSGEAQATVIVKALPQIGERHGETVCVAAIDEYRRWLRLYPIAFRQLEDSQKFGRWQRIRFKWRLPDTNRDNRAESRNVDQNSIQCIGELGRNHRADFLAPIIVESAKKERDEGRTLALIRPTDPEFYFRPRAAEKIEERRASYDRLRNAPDMFAAKQLVPLEPAPYEFGYRYKDADGEHDCRCHDWEVEQTFLNWRRGHEEQKVLAMMSETFGAKYPREGMAFAMGTHSRYPDLWMIIGVIKLPDTTQGQLF